MKSWGHDRLEAFKSHHVQEDRLQCPPASRSRTAFWGMSNLWGKKYIWEEAQASWDLRPELRKSTLLSASLGSQHWCGVQFHGFHWVEWDPELEADIMSALSFHTLRPVPGISHLSINPGCSVSWGSTPHRPSVVATNNQNTERVQALWGRWSIAKAEVLLHNHPLLSKRSKCSVAISAAGSLLLNLLDD